MALRQTLTVVKTGTWGKNFKRNAMDALLKSCDILCKINETQSKNSYISQRKMPYKNLIFGSIKYTKAIKVGDLQAVGVVFAGGADAYYAYYVDQGHKMRDGRLWPGYHFMLAGLEEAEKVASQIILEEFKKVS